MNVQIQELASIIARNTPPGGNSPQESAVPLLYLNRFGATRIPNRLITRALVCVTAQGSEQIYIGKNPRVCKPSSYLLVAQNFPLVRQVQSANDGSPYLGLTLVLDLPQITNLMQEIALPQRRVEAPRGVATGVLDADLLDSIFRLVRLLDKPAEIPVLGPMMRREVYYRLLLGQQGSYVRDLASGSKKMNRVTDGIEWLRRHMERPITMDELAKHMGMSLSTMHLWFRSVTSMTPLQFQKQLRLQKAKTMLLSEYNDVAAVASQVGYKSTSQFNREYRRMFNTSPGQDTKLFVSQQEQR